MICVHFNFETSLPVYTLSGPKAMSLLAHVNTLIYYNQFKNKENNENVRRGKSRKGQFYYNTTAAFV